MMQEMIQNDKYVELTYKIMDQKTNNILTLVEYPIGYVHGANSVLSSDVTAKLEGKSVGDRIEFPIDCNQLYGSRDESLVFTDHIENVPKEYREIGMTIVMESEGGKTKNFLVTRMDDKTLTIDGNNPLCGRNVIFKLEITMVRDATDEEIEIGGKVGADPTIEEILKE